MCEAREQRGVLIAAVCKIVKKGQVWIVPSQSGSGRYTVSPDEQSPYCSCPDHEKTGGICKHLYAVRMVIKREQSDDGTTETITKSVTITETIKRPTYRQDWKAYNAAQTNEKSHFQVLLRDLCQNVQEPVQVGRGQRMASLRDTVFANVFKVYSTVSGRRFMTDLKESRDKGIIETAPAYNTCFRLMESESFTAILKDLIVKSSLPLKAIETEFAVDATGFAGSKFVRWLDYKFNKMRKEHAWVKCHISVGVKTHVVTAAEVTDKNDCDSPELPALLAKTAENFTIREVSADKQYCSVQNIEAIDSYGAEPFIEFRSRHTGASGGLFQKAFHFFNLYREEFLTSYHKRSNVESALSMIKRKFGDSLRSKSETAMRNEVLCKIVCHNICCLIQSMYELGIDPKLIGA